MAELALKPQVVEIKVVEIKEPVKVVCRPCNWHGECEMDEMPGYRCPKCDLDVKFDGLCPTEERYLELCKKELNLKLALKDIRALKKEAEDELERLKAIGQIVFRW